MARSLNSRCDFDNGFFTCNLPEDAVLLVVKVKTKTGNYTLVEDMEKWTKKFRPWKKPTKDGNTSPRKFQGYCLPGRMMLVSPCTQGHALKAQLKWSTNLNSLMSLSV